MVVNFAKENYFCIRATGTPAMDAGYASPISIEKRIEKRAIIPAGLRGILKKSWLG
jgi:hypothetical protein